MSKTNKYALYFLMSLFFMWGFITCLNDILIPHLKALFDLSYFKTMLIQFCFFGAYFIMSMPSGYLISKFGYKNGIVIGLLVSSIGAFLFVPASIIISYPLFLFALFTLASGITLLQVSANPYVAYLGPSETASSRLNLTQALNSLGTTTAPAIGAYLILTDDTMLSSKELASKVQAPYIGIAVLLILIAILFWKLNLPNIHDSQNKTKTNKSIFSYPHLVFGTVAIFLYVGAEVSIGSFLISFISKESIGAMSVKQAGSYVSYYWGGLMLGRFIGSILLQKLKANRVLAFNSLVILVLVTATIFSSGKLAMWLIISVGLFESIMFPNIFTMSIQDLGEDTAKGSGVLCMAIVGGAIVPLIMGAFADMIGVQSSFFVTLFCFMYIFFFAVKGYKIGRSK